jgi:hypothetical protein
VTNQFLNAQVYANSMLLLLKNELIYGRLVDGQFKDQVTDENGLTVNVKRPPRFIDKKDGTANLATQDLIVGTAPVTVDQYSKVHISVGDIEYVQSYNALMQNETMKSAAYTLASSVDSFLASQTLKFNSWVAGGAAGTGGTNAAADHIITNAPQFNGAYTRLRKQGVPGTDLSATLNFDDAEAITGSLTSAYLPPDLNKPALQRMRIPVPLANINPYATQQVPSLTTGTRTQGDGSSTGAQINAASQNVNYRSVKGSAGSIGMTQTLSIKSLSANQTVKLGEVFTIQNVFAWDWRANGGLGQKLSHLQQFTVLADAQADGSGNIAALSISPAIIVQGTADTTGTTDANTAFGTVDSAPAANAYIKFVGAASAVLAVRAAFHKRAISLVSTRLHMPFSGVGSYAMDPETGIAIRYWRASDINTGAHVHRWDMMYGAQVMDPFLGTRICGS